MIRTIEVVVRPGRVLFAFADIVSQNICPEYSSLVMMLV